MPADIEDTLPRRPTAICPHCAGQNTHSATMCRHCMGPLTYKQNSFPAGTFYANAGAFQKAASSTTKPIVLLGMWIILGPATILWIAFAVRAFYDAQDAIYG